MAGEPMIENAPATDVSYRVFAGLTVIVTGKSPILNVKEQKTYDFRWVCVYVTGKDGWLLAVSQATRLPVYSGRHFDHARRVGGERCCRSQRPPACRAS